MAAFLWGIKKLIFFIFIMTGFTAGAQIAKLGFDAINTGCSRSGSIEGTGSGFKFINLLLEPCSIAPNFIFCFTTLGCLRIMHPRILVKFLGGGFDLRGIKFAWITSLPRVHSIPRELRETI